MRVSRNIHHSSFIVHPSGGKGAFSARRRGVLLLMILALLAMFGLIAVAFVVLTSHSKRGAASVERIDRVTDPPQKLLQQAAMQVFRGPSSSASVMGAHSLLEEMYGNEYAYGTVLSAVPVSATFPQLVNITLDTTAGLYTNTYNGTADTQLTTSTTIMAELARHIGSVLTVTGPTNSICYGQSTRIVAVSTSAAQMQVVAFSNGAVPPVATSFTINEYSVQWNGLRI